MGKGMKAGKRPKAPGAGNMQKQMQQMQQMQGTMMQMAALIAKTTGDTSIMQTLQEQGVPGPDMTAINTDAGQQIKTDSLGRAMNTDNSTQGKARQRVSSATEVQS